MDGEHCACLIGPHFGCAGMGREKGWSKQHEPSHGLDALLRVETLFWLILRCGPPPQPPNFPVISTEAESGKEILISLKLQNKFSGGGGSLVYSPTTWDTPLNVI